MTNYIIFWDILTCIFAARHCVRVEEIPLDFSLWEIQWKQKIFACRIQNREVALLEMSSYVQLPDDDTLVQQPSTLLFGVMGIATFIFFFFVLVIAIAWVFTSACPVSERITIRSVFIAIFGIIIVILLFADREPRYISSDMTPHVRQWSIFCVVWFPLNTNCRRYTTTPLSPVSQYLWWWRCLV